MNHMMELKPCSPAPMSMASQVRVATIAFPVTRLLAEQLGQGTRYQSIQLNNNAIKDNGHGGKAMSYRIDGSALPGVMTPLEFYYMVFGGNLTKEEVMQALKQRKSILDIMRFEERSHSKMLDKEDREKLQQYTSSIRDIELEISRERVGRCSLPQSNSWQTSI